MAEVYTSYFANLKNLPDNLCPISICGKAPDWYDGIQFKILAPKYSFFKVYEETHDKDYYIEHFQNEVLGTRLNPHLILNRLYELAGRKIPCLICYEKPGDFCHRHLVAEWLQNNCNIKVEEYTKCVDLLEI